MIFVASFFDLIRNYCTWMEKFALRKEFEIRYKPLKKESEIGIPNGLNLGRYK